MVPSGLTCTLVGAVMVKLPVAGVRFAADMEKLVDAPGVPAVVAVSVVVPPGTVIVGVKMVPDTAWFTVVALVLLNATLPD